MTEAGGEGGDEADGGTSVSAASAAGGRSTWVSAVSQVGGVSTSTPATGSTVAPTVTPSSTPASYPIPTVSADGSRAPVEATVPRDLLGRLGAAESDPDSGSQTASPADRPDPSAPNIGGASTAATTRTATAPTVRPTTVATRPTLVTTPAMPATTGPTTVATQPTTAAPSSIAVADRRILIFSRTTGYRHRSIVEGVAAVSDLARVSGFTVTASEDPALFRDDELARYDAVVFLSTSGDILNGSQQAAFERYIEGGGGWVGIHAASDTEYGWPWYGRLVGAWFADHPLVPNSQFVDCHCFTAAVHRRAAHPSTDHLPAVWSHRDEWYNFRSPIPSTATVLATVDESTYPGGTMGPHHPVTWTQTIGRGRSWYTSMGHTAASFADPTFRRHLQGGLTWAAGP